MVTVREAKEEKARRVLQRSLTQFKKRLNRRYQHAPHLELLDGHLMQVSRYVETGGREGVGRLIIEMPPRHGKTLSVSRLYPVWHLGRNPDHRVMLVSYGATLAYKNSRLARNYIRSPWYQAIFPGVGLAADSAAVDSWNLEGYDGGADALGIEGGATGKGAHLLIIDDPVKNRQEAESRVYRDRNWDSFNDDLYTRLEPGGAVIVMATRWHDDDLTGRILKHDPTWTRLRLPALAEEVDLLDREPGAALWPWRFPAEVLQAIRKQVGPYTWASLYQQRPQPREGGLFKYATIEANRVMKHPPLTRIVVAIDPATTSSAESDETGIVVAGLGQDDHGYILDDVTLKGSPARWAQEAIAAYHKYNADRIVAEVNNGGDMVENTIRTVRDAQDRPAGKNLPFKQVRASRGKITRAEPIESLYTQGRVHHVGTFDELEEQMCQYMQGAADSPDRMDALVWALTELMVQDGGTIPEWDMALA